MSNKYFAGNKGRYIFCDICGQATYAHEAIKLKEYTGRGGCIVCPNDADNIDHGLIPYNPITERAVTWTRINHTNVDNATAVIDYETTTSLGV